MVDVYDIGQEGDASFLVMELLRGESLRQRLARGPLAPTVAVDLLLPAMRGDEDVARTLERMHAHLEPAGSSRASTRACRASQSSATMPWPWFKRL